MNGILRRKMTRGAAAAVSPAAGAAGADQLWRLSFARAARAGSGLVVDATAQDLSRRSLAEVLELVPDRALIALLDGPGGRHGVIALSADLTSGLIESQTIGRVLSAAPAPRRPTRTDAAMVMDCIDRALSGLDGAEGEGEGAPRWPAGFRYASFVDDPRPLGLLLDDLPYLVAQSTLRFGEGSRKGQLVLALPESERAAPAAAARGPDPAAEFVRLLQDTVAEADCTLEAVLARTVLPLQAVLALAPGQMLPLTGAALDRIVLEGMDGRPVARARLGQARGLRALRLTGEAAVAADRIAPAAPPVPAEAAPRPALRAAG